MKTFKRIVLTFVIFLLLIEPVNSFGIENGKDASGNSHVVRIITQYSRTAVRSCSGGIISEYVVVTAAHCLNAESGLLSKEVWVLPAGATTKRDSLGVFLKDSSWIAVDSTQITLTYQNGTDLVEDDDLAFLVLTTPMKLDIQTNIPSEDETTKLRNSNAALRLYGYGYISDSGNSSDFPSFYVARFDNSVNVSIKNSGYATSTDSTVCQGDSGGPVLSVTPTNVTVVGVITGVTLSRSCGKKQSDGKYYALFTYLSRYANLAFAASSSASKKAMEDVKRVQTEAATAVYESETKLIEVENAKSTIEAQLDSVQTELDSAKARILELEKYILVLEKQIKSFSQKNTTIITCFKGSAIKKVSGVNPKCPSGYIKK